MKNKKNKWRRFLLRGSALMAAVVMCFAGSFPAFAAEDPADLGGSVDVLEGEWTFKNPLSFPSFLNDGSYSFDVDYTVYWNISAEEVEAFNDRLISGGSSDLIPVDDYSVGFVCSGLDMFVGTSLLEQSYGTRYFIFDYVPVSMTVEPHSDVVLSVLNMIGYPGQLGNETYHSLHDGWGTASWERTVDFGAGAAIDSSEFYAWFTSNAIPHRDMWSLTERLQSVASSIWSVIVTIASTIVSNPFLLLTFGFFFLGGCIALFSRLLARR